MFPILWNYLRGYVIIEVSGFSVERFINLASKKGIIIWDLKETQKGAEMKVSVRSFKKLKVCSKKSQCHIKIKNRSGGPFIINKLKKRQLYIFGIIMFITLLYTLSSFVWLIEISGNERLKTKDIINFCETKGFYIGSYKNSINTVELKRELKNHFPEISWIAIELKGTKAIIQLRETLPKIKTIDISEPCNIIAKDDAIIESIVTKKGTPLVKKGDVVSKGDILVSGELIVKEDETGVLKNYTHSAAEIKARLTHKITASIPFEYSEKVYTGREKNTYGIKLFNNDISIYNPEIDYKDYDSYSSLNQLKITENYPLPFIMVTNIHKEYTLKKKNLTLAEAKKRGEKLIDKKIIEEFDFSTDILDKDYSYEKNDKNLVITANISVIENIGEEQKIENSERRTPINGTPENTNKK